MAIVKGTIIETGQEVDISIPTVKIPELPETAEGIEALDKFPFWDHTQGKTLWVGAQALRDYMITGGLNTPETPVLFGDRYEITITEYEETHNSGLRVDVPELAGDQFVLERRGVGEYKINEFEILPSGGFILTDGNPVRAGEVFIARVFSYNGSPGENNVTASILKGIALIGSSVSISSIHFNKLCYFSATPASLIATLPDITTAPENLLLCFQTATNVTKKSKVETSAGQNIYFGESATQWLWLGKSETLWLYNGGDGWYVLNDPPGILGVGDIEFGYKQRMNTLVMKGQLVNRADEPRLWEWVQTLGSSLIDDSVWGTPVTIDSTPDTISTIYPFKGCFSRGNGSTTFRLPDHQNMFWRGLNNIGLSDTERHSTSNFSGVIQKDQIRKHKHDAKDGDSATVFIKRKPGGPGGGLGVNDSPDGYEIAINGTAYAGGKETRSVNVGLLPLIKC